MSVISIEQSKYTILLKKDKYFILVVSFNETRGGYFVNFYDIEEHYSRHKSLTAWRSNDGKTSLILQNKEIKDINNRNGPVILPSKTALIKNCIFNNGLRASYIKAHLQNVNIISYRNFKIGPRSIGIIWPNNKNPTKAEIEDKLSHENPSEELKYMFFPNCFSNTMAIGIYDAKENSKIIPLEIDGPIQTNNSEWTDIPGSTFTYNASKHR